MTFTNLFLNWLVKFLFCFKSDTLMCENVLCFLFFLMGYTNVKLHEKSPCKNSFDESTKDNNFSTEVSKGHRSDVITVELAVPCRILEFYRPLPLLCYRCRATPVLPFLRARRDVRRRSRITLLLSDIQ